MQHKEKKAKFQEAIDLNFYLRLVNLIQFIDFYVIQIKVIFDIVLAAVIVSILCCLGCFFVLNIVMFQLFPYFYEYGCKQYVATWEKNLRFLNNNSQHHYFASNYKYLNKNNGKFSYLFFLHTIIPNCSQFSDILNIESY